MCPNLAHDVVFGTDFQYAYHITIDVRRKRLNFGVSDEIFDRKWCEKIPISFHPIMVGSDPNLYTTEVFQNPTPYFPPRSNTPPPPSQLTSLYVQPKKSAENPIFSKNTENPPPHVNKNREQVKVNETRHSLNLL